MKGLSEKIFVGGFVLALLMLAGVSMEAYLNIQKLIESRKSVEHTHQVLEQFDNILLGLEDAERGRRGYVYLQNDRELEILRLGIQETNRATAGVRQLTRDHPDQQRRLDELEPIVAKRLALLQKFVDLRQKQADPSIQTAILKQTLILQQEIKARLKVMETTEQILLQRRLALTDASIERATLVNGIGYCLSFSLLGGTFFLLRNQIRVRKQAELAVQKYAEDIYDLYNQAPCGYHSLDAEGTLIRVNDTELGWLGYTRDEVIQKKKFVDLVTPDSSRIFQESFFKFKEQGWISDLEFELVRKDGTIFPVSLSATAIKDEAGNFVMSRSTLFDIHDRKRAENERQLAQTAL
ncbi:MAG: CHASE3 domain-containing protein, partial [Kovacikia sp.]